jgi:hypothetical protein
MSAINGDKSRHQINRKRAVKRRMKIREMVAARPQAGEPAKGGKAAPSRPSGDRS